MNREILFRGLDSNGEWVYGNLIKSFDSVEDFETLIIPSVDSNMYVNHMDLGFENWYKVNKETVGQFTGLLDYNKIKIFEHDLTLDEENNCYGIIEFQNGNFGVQWYGTNGYFAEYGWEEEGEFGKLGFEPLSDFNMSEFKIHGNIHQNKELISGC